MARVLLSLDLSSTATGWSRWDLDTKKLISFGVIKPDFKNPTVKGVPTYIYPQFQVLKLRRLAEQVLELIDDSVAKIIIEEINSGKNRLGQKTLDGLHFMLLDKMSPTLLSRVSYYDSDGREGWRSANGLKLQLSPQDRLLNKDRKKLNKKLGKGKKVPVITQKTLACRFVNRELGLSLDADKETTDGDKADALGLAIFYLTKVTV